MENKTEKVYNPEFMEKTHSLREEIYKVIDGKNNLVLISALMPIVEEAIIQIDDKDVRNKIVDLAIKELKKRR